MANLSSDIRTLVANLEALITIGFDAHRGEGTYTHAMLEQLKTQMVFNFEAEAGHRSIVVGGRDLRQDAALIERCKDHVKLE